jgi:HlyD family secretion protein
MAAVLYHGARHGLKADATGIPVRGVRRDADDMKKWTTVLLIIAAIGAGLGAYYIRRGGPEIQVNTAPITRGDIIDSVGATGTLQAVTTVQVGSQVSGNIQWLGADFNSIVRKGQQIARLDPSLFQTQVEQARANLTRAKAEVERNRVAVDDAQIKFNRAKELTGRSLMPQSELDTAKSTLDAARAQLQSADAQVVQAQAAVNQAEVNLEHTVITAPIDGIVTSRDVDVGQTVAASLQSPTLFVIAADLTKMQVNANIDEADVGRIRPAQRVTFRVDAYPTEEFTGTVAQIRLQPVVVQNVTTYGTVIDVPNQELKLKPGMTANVKIEIARRSDVLRVSTAALRFRPTPEVFAALHQAAPAEMPFASGRGRGGRSGPGTSSPSGTRELQSTEGNPAPPAPPPSAGNPSSDRSQGGPAPQGGSGAPLQFRRGDEARKRSGGNLPPSNPGEPTGNGEGGDRRQGGNGFGGRGGSSGDSGRGRFDPARMMERFKGLSPDGQKQFVERLKSRGMDVSAFEKEMKANAPGTAMRPKYGAPQSAQTIDALFAPLPVVETRGRAWLFIDRQLKPVTLRLGISDGTNTELLSTELQQNMEVVTGVTGLGSTRALPTPAGTGNPLMPGGGRGPGGFGGGGGRGR